MTEKDNNKIATRPASPSTTERAGSGLRPYELDPELAQIRLAEIMIGKLGTPAVVSKPFVVRYGIFHALNHTLPLFRDIDGQLKMVDPGNETGYDCSLRLHVYRQVAAQSVNVDGAYFNDFWAYLMKPKYIINGMNGQPNQFDDEKESIAGRIMGFFRGGKKNDNGQHT